MRKNKDELIEFAHKKFPELTVHETAPKYLRKVVAAAAMNNFERIIVCGGDGSVATAAHILAKTGIELGIVPGGTTNSFARGLGIPLDMEKALHLAVSGKSEAINLGSVNGHMFISVAAIGLSEEIASDIPDNFKKLAGRASYLIYGVGKLVAARPFNATIKVAGKSQTAKTFQIVVANASLHGSLPVAKGAHAKKPELIVLAFGRKGSKLKQLGNYLAYALTSHEKSKDVIIHRTNEVEIMTNRPKKIEVDGEVITRTPAVFKLERSSLKLVLKK